MPKPSSIDSAVAHVYARAFLIQQVSQPYGRDCHACEEPLSVGEILLDYCCACGARPSEDPTFTDDDLPF